MINQQKKLTRGFSEITIFVKFLQTSDFQRFSAIFGDFGDFNRISLNMKLLENNACMKIWKI